jgi:erythromycin esterase
LPEPRSPGWYLERMRAAASVLVAWALLSAMAHPALAVGDDERVAWLRGNAIPLATIDPASRDLTDLAPLREVLAGVRVVMLGEATRGDGSAFLAKTRLIRFLHQELGFDVLVFEAGFYDCARAWDEVRAGADARQALGGALPFFYTQAAQFQPLLELVAARAASDRPLAFAGIDSQMGGGVDGRDLGRALRAALPGLGIPPESVASLAELEVALADATLERYATGEVAVPARQQRQRILDALAELRRRLRPAGVRYPPAAAAGAEGAFWLQVLDNVTTFLEASWKVGRWEPGSVLSPQVHNLHDHQMAANLAWLARERFAGRKLIVWSLSVHLARDLDRLTTGEVATRERFDVMSTVGDEVAAALGDEAYTLAVTAYGGDKATPGRSPYPLLVPTAGSFEDLMHRTGLEAALVDLRHLPASGGWLRRGLIARPISHKELLGIWPRHLDGLLFLRRSEASRRVGE